MLYEYLLYEYLNRSGQFVIVMVTDVDVDAVARRSCSLRSSRRAAASASASRRCLQVQVPRHRQNKSMPVCASRII